MARTSDTYDNGTLRNHFGITDATELASREADISGFRYQRLFDGDFPLGFPATNGSDRLQAIHQYLFGPIYPFAGQFRQTPLSKADFETGPQSHTHFTLPTAIKRDLATIFRILDSERAFKGLGRLAFVQGAAYFLADLNLVHPFREGNGRTQRAYLALLAREAGHRLSFKGITPERMVSASIAAAGRNVAPMQALLDEATDPLRQPLLERSYSYLNDHEHRNMIAIDQRVLATATPGDTYTGQVFAWGRNAPTFILVDEGGAFIVANAQDLPAGHQDGPITFTATETAEQRAHRWYDQVESEAKPGHTTLAVQRALEALSPPADNRDFIDRIAPRRLKQSQARDQAYFAYGRSVQR